VAKKSEPPGCRSAAIATSFLVVLALAFMAIGLTLINQSGGCREACETLAITVLYAGLPISGVFGIVFGELALAWPLDVTFWVVAGFLLARLADNRRIGVLGPAILLVTVALIYGLVLSLFVELVL
jgi:hypothetical protein